MANETRFTTEALRAEGWIETERGFVKQSCAVADSTTGRTGEPTSARIRRPKPKRDEARASHGGAPANEGCKARVTFIHLRSSLFDLDNLDAKDLIDAIRDGGLVRDDSPDVIEEIRVRQIKVGKGEEAVIIHLEYL